MNEDTESLKRYKLLPRYIRYKENSHRILKPKKSINKFDGILKKLNLNYFINRIDNELEDDLRKKFFNYRITLKSFYDNFGKNYTLGKGLTAKQSIVSGMYELIERYSAIKFNKKKIIRASFNNFKNLGLPVINPREIYPPRKGDTKKNQYNDDIQIDWTLGWDLTQNSEIYIPTDYTLLFPYGDDKNLNHMIESRPNGLAAGNCPEEAILHGIFEVIERDAQAIFTWSQLPMPEIDIDSIFKEKNKSLIKALKAIKSSNIRLILKNITSDIGIPTIYAFGMNKKEEGPIFQWGVGTHLDPTIAITRALTEMIQVRAMFKKFNPILPKEIDNLASLEKYGFHKEALNYLRFFYPDALDSVRYIFASRDILTYKEIEDHSQKDINKEISLCIKKLSHNDIKKVIIVDLTNVHLKIPAFRVIIPKLEFIPWIEKDKSISNGRRLSIVPPKLGYLNKIEYNFGSGKNGNFLL